MKISKAKKDKISEQLLSFLFSISPQATFTSHIAQEVARDEEFIKKILFDLKKKGIILSVDKNSKGTNYLKRTRWKLSPEVFEIYQKKI